jgi:hypothetical protein
VGRKWHNTRYSLTIADFDGANSRVSEQTTHQIGDLMLLKRRIEGSEPRHLFIAIATINIYSEGDPLDQRDVVWLYCRWRNLSSQSIGS